MTAHDQVESEYIEEAHSTKAPASSSQTKQFLKRPVEQQDLQRYGTSKPIRVIMRAKLIHGKD